MEVRGNHQHRFELRELSRSLGGYRIVIDESIPYGEIHVVTEYPVHIASGGRPEYGGSTVLTDTRVIQIQAFASCA